MSENLTFTENVLLPKFVLYYSPFSVGGKYSLDRLEKPQYNASGLRVDFKDPTIQECWNAWQISSIITLKSIDVAIDCHNG